MIPAIQKPFLGAGFSEQIKRNNKVKTQDKELVLKAGRALGFHLLSFLLFLGCCCDNIPILSIWYYFTYYTKNIDIQCC